MIEDIILRFFSQDFLWTMIGLILGIGVGVLPGLCSVTAFALLLPMSFGMEVGAAVAFLMAVFVGSVYGGSITSIVLGIPGDPTSVATMLDGYPLTKKGHSLTALGASIMSSSVGGIIGALVLIFFAPLIGMFVVYNIGSVAYAWLIVISLTFIVAAIQEDVVKGVASAFLGFMVATIGMDVLTPRYRFTFGNIFLGEGIPFIPFILGIFAFSHLLGLSQEEKGARISRLSKLQGSLWEGMKEPFRHFGVFIRSILMGAGLGALPGIGGAAVNLMAYFSAKRTYDQKGTFGKGDVRGVIAAESSNNASVATTLIPMITLAIPGGATVAILMGVLIIHGLTPGPALFTRHLDFVYRIFAAVLAANILLFPIAVATLKPFARISLVKVSTLVPVILTFIFFGSFGLRILHYDVIVTLVFGALSFFLTRYGFPILPFLMAFILGPIFESNFRRALLISEGNFSIFLSTTIHWVLAIIAVLLIAWPIISKRIKAERNKQIEKF